MTERQRRALLKQHPEVSSWSEFFATQRKQRSVS
jgi:WhiB family redox-sensing transcriptional regulator